MCTIFQCATHLPLAPASCSRSPPALGPAHACGDARRGADRDVGLHTALPQSAAAVPIGGVHGPAHAVLVIAHVAVGHADGVDIGVDESRVPHHRVGDTVDVVPPPSVEADEVAAEGGADLHQLKGRLDLFDEDVDLDRAYR